MQKIFPLLYGLIKALKLHSEKKERTTWMIKTPEKYFEDLKKDIPLFVYGTLKQGENRDHHLMNFLKQDGYIFAELWTLISYPYILHGEDKVYGELYYIDKDVALNIHYMETQEKAWAPEEVLFYPNTGENPKQVITYFGTTRLLELIEQNKHAHFKCSKNSWTKSNSGLTEEECKQYSLYYEE